MAKLTLTTEGGVKYQIGITAAPREDGKAMISISAKREGWFRAAMELSGEVSWDDLGWLALEFGATNTIKQEGVNDEEGI